MGRHQQENRGQRSQCRVSLKGMIHNADIKECMCDEGGLEERKINVGFHLTGKKEVYQGKHPVFRQEENVMEKEKQALAMTEDSWKH